MKSQREDVVVRFHGSVSPSLTIWKLWHLSVRVPATKPDDPEFDPQIYMMEGMSLRLAP